MNAGRLNIGVLGCGQIAQAAHLESCRKARNARLYAICEVDDGLRDRMAAIHTPDRAFAHYDEMLADPDLDAVIVATADALHVPQAIRALDAGKHVLCEKPMARDLEQAELLAATVRATGRVLQVGHMKRYDIGLQEARRFIDDGIGELVALKAWYCDSTRRYEMTDALQPIIVEAEHPERPPADDPSDRENYHLRAHGSHLLDTARFLGGPITSVRARRSNERGMHCWFVDVEFENGALGHLDLTVAVRMGWHEGFHVYGSDGSIVGRTFNPWYLTTSVVDIFRERDGSSHRPLGADGHFYRRQVEGFADTVLHGAPMTGADADDGVASVRGMLAIARSVETGDPVALDGVTGAL